MDGEATGSELVVTRKGQMETHLIVGTGSRMLQEASGRSQWEIAASVLDEGHDVLEVAAWTCEAASGVFMKIYDQHQRRQGMGCGGGGRVFSRWVDPSIGVHFEVVVSAIG